MNSAIGKVLRIIAIIFLGLTSLMNVLGGVGTTCAAFFTENYPSMMVLMDYRWLYQAFVVFTLLIGIAGVWATITLARGKESAYRNALIVLVIGTLVGGIHYYASQALRGSAAPANMVFYINVFTLLLFLVLRIPGLREKVDFSRTGDHTEKSLAGGLAAIVAGIVLVTAAIWAGPSHTYQGDNWVLLLIAPLIIFGTILTLLGIALMFRVVHDQTRIVSAETNVEIPFL
jgi:hypothetical protein